MHGQATLLAEVKEGEKHTMGCKKPEATRTQANRTDSIHAPSHSCHRSQLALGKHVIATRQGTEVMQSKVGVKTKGS